MMRDRDKPDAVMVDFCFRYLFIELGRAMDKKIFHSYLP